MTVSFLGLWLFAAGSSVSSQRVESDPDMLTVLADHLDQSWDVVKLIGLDVGGVVVFR